MSFLGSEHLKAAAETIINPFNVERVKHGAYELSVGAEYYDTSMKTGKAVVTAPEKQIHIPPGQLALLITAEVVTVPETQIALISIKFGAKMKGLVNVSGFHVDPGFSGKLIFSVYNAGSNPAFFDPGKALFLIWFSEMSGIPDPYNGGHNGQDRITAQHVSELYGDVASPAQLKEDLRDVSTRVENLRIIALVLLAAAVGPQMVFWVMQLTRLLDNIQPVSLAGFFFVLVAIGPFMIFLGWKRYRRWRRLKRYALKDKDGNST